MFVEFNWLEAVTGSPILLVLIACSVVMLGVAVERTLYYWRLRGRPDELLKLVLAQIGAGDLERARASCRAAAHPLGVAAAEMIRRREAPSAQQEEHLLIALSERKLVLERNLGLLGTMAAVTPLIGLLGTVYGIMQAFHDMGVTGSSAPSVVAAGVAEALLTTGAGLVVAVPALLLFNQFNRRMNVMLTLAENGARMVRSALADQQTANPPATTRDEPAPTLSKTDRELPLPLEIG